MDERRSRMTMDNESSSECTDVPMMQTIFFLLFIWYYYGGKQLLLLVVLEVLIFSVHVLSV